ncbi:ABC transporter substrate-binding protein [Algicella marina]|uniref:Extracellular solute-binding protein n=1 Tax=Algicella marina TaxID=2683284 RepID=A0A6P1SXM8_9RHOB|nr:sugar ABC transporter substrate-binding protein [Algicella marina]QHQ34305.1 extracellular solute-binding protein [Algicella marina]
MTNKTKTRAFAAALLAGTALASAASAQNVNFWYHFDNADNPMSDLVEKFEAENPGITVTAENVPWNSYYDQLYTSIVAGTAPDAALVKLNALPRLIEMEALEPLDARLEGWEGLEEIQDNLLNLTAAADGTHYYLPVQYVVLYLYYRTDMFEELGLTPPATCDDFREAAKALTRDTDGDGRIDTYGFGFRGGKGGHDHWGSLVLSREGVGFGAGELTSDAGVAGTQFVLDLFQEDAVFPPSAPNDGFKEVIGAFQGGTTAMTIHHIGSSAGMVEALGDNVSAVPVPECGGGRWTSFGDESTAIFANAQDKEAAWKWISFLSSPENNAAFNVATGQLPVTKTDSANWTVHEQRFVDATIDSLPFAHLLPNVSETADFANTVWPVAMQRALIGELSAAEMNAEIDALYND